LVITNGGVVVGTDGRIGCRWWVSNNLASVSGEGSLWTNSNTLSVGDYGTENQLEISDGGTVIATELNLGAQPTSAGNRLTVDDGTLRVRGNLDIRRGTGMLNAGLVETDLLLLTNATGSLQFKGGTLSARSATVSNGSAFVVGGGARAATYRMTAATGSGHSFDNGLLISSNSVLSGSGTITGSPITLAAGAVLEPGLSIGTIVFSRTPALQGRVVMDISRSAGMLTNDRIQVIGPLVYGGELTVSNMGPDSLAEGDRFPLFEASSYAGSLTTIILPVLPAGLQWADRLLMDGSIEVIAQRGLSISAVTRAGTNLVLEITGGSSAGDWNLLTSTNLTLPPINWSTQSWGVFDGFGNVRLTNGIDFDEPRRYYRISTP
jgi:T5SS/PEP-CTERM-associated repeat protein